MSQKLHYRKVGSGPAVLLIHGFPDSGEIWREIGGRLAEKFTVIIPDLPGAGSSKLSGPTSIKEMASLIEGVLASEHIDSVVMVGHSMGGYTAAAFAGMYPERLFGLSLVHSFAGKDDDDKIRTRKKTIKLLQNHGKKVFVAQMTPNLFAEEFVLANPDIIANKVRSGMEMSTDAMINFYDAMIGRDDNLPSICEANCPIQWVIGKKDNVTNYTNVIRESYQSRVNFVTLYEDCGHISIVEQSEKLLDDLTQFVEYCYTAKP